MKRELKPTISSKFDSIPPFQDVAEVFVQQSEVFLSIWLLMLNLSLLAVIIVLREDAVQHAVACLKLWRLEDVKRAVYVL